MSNKSLKRFLVMLFGLAFIGSTAFLLIGSLLSRRSSSPPVVESTTTPTETPQVNVRNNARSRLESQALGYEKLLEKEPENTTILISLVRTKLEMGDLKGAIAPLNKLIELEPNSPEFSATLKEIETILEAQKLPSEK